MRLVEDAEAAVEAAYEIESEAHQLSSCLLDAYDRKPQGFHRPYSEYTLPAKNIQHAR